MRREAENEVIVLDQQTTLLEMSPRVFYINLMFHISEVE